MFYFVFVFYALLLDIDTKIFINKIEKMSVTWDMNTHEHSNKLLKNILIELIPTFCDAKKKIQINKRRVLISSNFISYVVSNYVQYMIKR